jgi:hypothetical protein
MILLPKNLNLSKNDERECLELDRIPLDEMDDI